MENEENTARPQTLEETLSAMTPPTKDYILGVFLTLQSSPRFNDFLENNFIIDADINDETQSVNIQVMEKPEVKPTFLVTDEMAARICVMLRQEFTVHNATAALQRMLAILNGKDDTSLIVGATDTDLSNELKAQSILKGTLD